MTTPSGRWEALGRGTRVAVLFSVMLSLGVAFAVRETLRSTLDATRLDDTAHAATTGLPQGTTPSAPVSTGTQVAPPAPSAGGPGLSEPPPGASLVVSSTDTTAPAASAGGVMSYTPSVPAAPLPADPAARRRALERQADALRRETSRLHTVQESQQLQARLSATLAQLEALGSPSPE
jgi:hypothetical protein